MTSDSPSGESLRSVGSQVVRSDGDVNDHGSLPWGSNDLTSEKPVLHYITHTYSCRKQPRLEVSAANTCKQTRSRLDAGRSPQPRAHSECARNARESPTHFPHSRMPAAAQRGSPAAEGRARVRSGATGGAGDAQPPSREFVTRILPVPSPPRRATRGPPAPLSGQRGPTYSATILLGTFGGPPRQNYTTIGEILDFPSRHRRARIQREGQI